MLRLAVIRPGKTGPLYEEAIARAGGLSVEIVVGESPIAAGAIAADEEQLAQHFDQFDACVVHADVDVGHVHQWIDAGKHILLDCPNYDAAMLDQLARRGRESGVRLMVSQPQRLTPYATSIRSDLDAGLLGQPGLVRIHRWEPIANSAGDSLQSQLWQLMVHELDLACWLYGMAPERVLGQALETEGSVSGVVTHCTFPQGMAILDCAFHTGDRYYMVTAIGSQGAAYADDHHNTNLMLKDRAEALIVGNNDNWLRHQLAVFSQFIQSGANDQTIDDTKRSIVVCQAAVESAAANRVAKRVGDRYELQ